MDPVRERRALFQGADIVVGTPGRLRDHLERGALDLSAAAFAVLDEADEMLDMGFRDDLEELLDATPEGRRTFLFSATMPKPIQALAKRYQRDALRVSTIDERQGHGDIAYEVVTVSPADIEHAVINLLRFHEAETAMLFCATRDNVRHLHATLVERGFAAVALSGEHSQNERNHALQALRDGRARVCVATDVAARGIDVATLSLVIHVEVPRDAEVLQHRSGRTGRAGRKGTAVLIVPYPRRRRVEGMLRAARISADWIAVPDAEVIRQRDRERLLEILTQPVEASEADLALAGELLSRRDAIEIAAALVQAHRKAMPEPEELIDISTREGSRSGARSITAKASTISCGSAWTSAGARTPIRAGSCRCCAAAGISPATRWARSASPPTRHGSRSRTLEARFVAAVKRTAREDAGDERRHDRTAAEPPRDTARRNARQQRGGPNDGPNDRPRPNGPRGNHGGQTASARRPRLRKAPAPQGQAGARALDHAVGLCPQPGVTSGASAMTAPVRAISPPMASCAGGTICRTGKAMAFSICFMRS
jgi:ATP-dependent RNA helicase DeaD